MDDGLIQVSRKAEWSLYLGLLVVGSNLLFAGERMPEVMLMTVFLPPAAIVLGLLARRDVRRSGGRLWGWQMANLGIFSGALGFGCCILAPAIDHDPWSARRAQVVNNFKQIGLALHNYEAANGRLPQAVVRDAEGRPLYSWRVLVLPFLEQQNLYNEFHLDEPWDSPHNRPLADRVVWIFAPLGPTETARQRTHVMAFVGPGTAFESPAGEPFERPDDGSNFPDGLDRTILVVEARQAVPWSAPIDLPYGPGIPLPPLGGNALRERRPFGLGPERSDEFVALFTDGRVRTLADTTPEPLLRSLIVRDDGAPAAVPGD